MRKSKFSDNLLWIVFLTIMMVFLVSYAEYGLYLMIHDLGPDISPAVTFINENYTPFLADVIVLVIVCLVVKKKSFYSEILPPQRERKGS